MKRTMGLMGLVATMLVAGGCERAKPDIQHVVVISVWTIQDYDKWSSTSAAKTPFPFFEVKTDAGRVYRCVRSTGLKVGDELMMDVSQVWPVERSE